MVLGGGTGGTLVANRLRRALDPGDAAIVVVDHDNRHVYQPGLLFVPFGLGEALPLAEALGLTRESAYQVLAATPLAAQAERRRPSLESGEYPPRFPLALAGKDARLIAEAAAAAGADLRVTAAAGSWLADAEDTGAGGRDYVAVLETILAGRVRASRQ